MLEPDRSLPWDWYPGTVPGNVVVDPGAYIETTFSFHLFRSAEENAVVYERGASTYLGTMFDLGRRGRVRLGECALVHGARIICDDRIEIGDHALISWNVVLMDSRRMPATAEGRRGALRAAAETRLLHDQGDAAPITIERNVWIGFDACILPGVTVGEGSIVGARSVVFEDVPPYTVAAGNPARIIRSLDRSSGSAA